MKNKINILDLGKMDYKPSWEFQKNFHADVLKGNEPDTLILVEHEPVFTLGKNASQDNLLDKNNSDVKVFNVERGGDITFHGPGQLVGYPILNLNNFEKNISWFMRILENILIECLSVFKIAAHQKKGLTGVWVNDEKIGAQGVKISRWVTMHGFSLNINTDLRFFKRIVPCGIANCKVTSMEKLLGAPQNMQDVKFEIVEAFNNNIFFARKQTGRYIMSKLKGFQKKQLLQIYRNMVIARKLDEKEMALLKQGKAFFHIGCSGHEAAQLAAANNMNSSKDWAYPYYRDAALCLGLGMTGKEQLLSFLAKDSDPNSGGRQMPQHYGHKDLRIVSQSSPTGTQFLQAVGSAMSRKWDNKKEIVYVSSGEGSTSEGEFHEALNWASREKLPVIFHIQDNEYAISVHISEQTSGSSVFDMVSGYKNLSKFDVDGTDFFETNLAFNQAISRARKGKGPSVVVSHVVRLLSHSSSDDQRKYRSQEDLESDLKRDPIKKFENECLKAKVFTKKEISAINLEIDNYIEESIQWVQNQADPSPNSAFDHLYAKPISVEEMPPNTISDKIVLVDAINHAISEEMDTNSKIIVYGEDIADPKGGVFTATKGLTEKFGKDRVFNSPLAEASIVGTAIGLAVTGWKPCVEIQFGDYIWPAMMQIRDEAACMRYRSKGSWTCPLVVRVAVGGYIHGGLYHSQSIDSYFFNMPGIRVAYPSNAADAKGLLKTALRMEDPVIFLEHKGLYRQGYASTPEPNKDFLVPFGKANLVQEGDYFTIVTWGAMVQKCIDAIKILNLEIGEADLIDIRTLNPIDWETIYGSVKKTGKLLIVHEDLLTGGIGAEISARVSDNLFEDLDGPIKRVAAKDCHVPYSDFLESQVLPQTEEIVDAINDLMEY